MSVETDPRKINRDVPVLGKRSRNAERSRGIPNRKILLGFAAVSRGLDRSTGTFSCRGGDVVACLGGVLPGPIALRIPAITYAVLLVRPRNRFGWPTAITAAKPCACDVSMSGFGYRPVCATDDF